MFPKGTRKHRSTRASRVVAEFPMGVSSGCEHSSTEVNSVVGRVLLATKFPEEPQIDRFWQVSPNASVRVIECAQQNVISRVGRKQVSQSRLSPPHRLQSTGTAHNSHFVTNLG
jgi:hypothetical protein